MYRYLRNLHLVFPFTGGWTPAEGSTFTGQNPIEGNTTYVLTGSRLTSSLPGAGGEPVEPERNGDDFRKVAVWWKRGWVCLRNVSNPLSAPCIGTFVSKRLSEGPEVVLSEREV